MRLVIITKRYDSSVINQKVQPTPLDAEGNPMYAIYLSDERAQTLIDAGVAEEYVTEDLIVDDSNDDESEEQTTDTKSKSNSKKNKSSK
jgi:hypothetical protein